ncbi:MAG: uL30 family ribosomal protein, partial [Nitrososphaera sp.]
MAYLVVRIKGTVNIPTWARTTLDNLNLDKRFRATLVPETAESLGMLRKVKEVVAWTKADTGIVKELLEKRGRKEGYKVLTKADLPKEYKSMDELATAIAGDKVAMSKLEGIKPWFALSPP